VNWRKVYILVEGQTEESFVKYTLLPGMPQNLCLQPVIVATKRVNSGGKFKGGVPSYRKVRNEVMLLLNDSSAKMVTTMLDFYGLPTTFPGRANPQGSDAHARVQFVEQSWDSDISSQRFKAYLSLHEFEALLFSKPDEIAESFTKPSLLPALQNIRNNFKTPEEIDDNSATAPSACLERLYSSYNKPYFGRLIASRIGLEAMLKSCRHFARWVSFLRSL
jgi:Domain of unknown function (DUF4276)